MKMARGRKRRLAVALSVVSGIVLFAVILRWIGWRQIAGEIRQLGWVGSGVLLGDVALMVLLWMWSWRIILRAYGVRPSWGLLARATLSGYAISYLTPSMYFGGEPLRIYVLTKEASANPIRVTATVVVGKFLEGVTLVGFVLLGSVNALLDGRLSGVQELVVIGGNLLLLGLLGMAAWSFSRNRLWASRLFAGLERLWPWGRARARLIRWGERLQEAEQDIHQAFVQHARAMWKALGASFLATLSVYVRPWIFFHFTDGVGFSFKELSLIFALFFFLSTFLWLTPGGIGISEGGLIGIFGLVGVGPAGAVAYSLAVKGLELIFVGLGMFYLVHFGLVRLPRLKRKRGRGR